MGRRQIALLLMMVSAVIAAHCGSGATSVVGPTGEQRCGMTLTVNTPKMESAGGTGTATITTARDCQWSVTSTATWLTITPPAGQGNAEISYVASPNLSTAARSVDLVAGEQRATVSQDAARCTIGVSPGNVTMPSSGGEASARITTDDYCSWTAESQAPWIVVMSAASGSGSTDLILRVAENGGGDRTGAVKVGTDQTFTIVQSGRQSGPGSGCTYSLSRSSEVVPAAGGAVTFGVATASGCAWVATSNVPWIRVQTGASESQSASIVLAVDPNPGPQREGIVTAAGVTFTVTQQGTSTPPCTFNVSPARFDNLPAAASTVDVTVSTTSTCAWTVANLPSWVSAKPAGGTGNGVTTLAVQANTGAARSATITVATRSIPISQVAAAACSYSINPTTINNVAASGGTSQVSITTSAGCAWTVANLPSWVSANPTGGTGSGNTTFTVQSNGGTTRSATITVATRSLPISQAAAVACSYSINPTSLNNVAASGGTTQVSITTTAGCAWSVADLPSWVSASPASGAGNANTTLTVQSNAGTARSATVTVATRPLPISQAAAPVACSYSINPASISNESFLGGTTQVTITTTAGCAWTVTGAPSWITFAPGGGTGSGATVLGVQLNLGSARDATLSIAGKSFPVNQVKFPAAP